MTSRLRVLALIVAALALAGCTSAISGHGTLAADSGPVDPTDPATDPVDPVTDRPTDPVTEPPPDDPTVDPGGGNATVTRTPAAEGNVICQIYSDEDVAGAFGEPVTVDEFGESTCQLEAADSVHILISHWESLTPRDAMFDSDAAETTIRGHPALRGDSQITVAVGGDLDTEGTVDGSEVLYDSSDEVFSVLTPLLEQAVDAF